MKAAKQKYIYLGSGLIVIIIGIISAYFVIQHNKNQSVTSFDTCVAAGHPVLNSYPERCMTPDGKSFTKIIKATFEGELICAQHTNSDAPHTLECASALKVSDSMYYLLNTSGVDNALMIATGSNRRVKITGTLQPTSDQTYVSQGIITVTNFEFL